MRMICIAEHTDVHKSLIKEKKHLSCATVGDMSTIKPGDVALARNCGWTFEMRKRQRQWTQEG